MLPGERVCIVENVLRYVNVYESSSGWVVMVETGQASDCVRIGQGRNLREAYDDLSDTQFQSVGSDSGLENALKTIESDLNIEDEECPHCGHERPFWERFSAEYDEDTSAELWSCPACGHIQSDAYEDEKAGQCEACQAVSSADEVVRNRT